MRKDRQPDVTELIVSCRNDMNASKKSTGNAVVILESCNCSAAGGGQCNVGRVGI
jgi:hypothetical protein